MVNVLIEFFKIKLVRETPLRIKLSVLLVAVTFAMCIFSRHVSIVPIGDKLKTIYSTIKFVCQYDYFYFMSD